MPIVVTCPSCGSRFQAPESLAGKRGKCPKCGTVLDIPGAAAPPRVAPASDTALTAGERLHPCPDCGQMISRRAAQCPHCGCPVTEPAVAPAPPNAPKPAAPSSRKLIFALLGGGLVVVLVLVGGALLWKMLNAAPSLPAPPPVAAAPVPQVSTEQKEAWIAEVARDSAEHVDRLQRQLHEVKAMIGQLQQSSDLMQALAKGDLSKQPGEEALPESPAASYLSQLEPLTLECTTYLRSHLPAGKFDIEKLREVAAAWVREKEAPIQRELEHLVQ